MHEQIDQPTMCFYRAVFDSDHGAVARGVVWAEVRFDALLQPGSQDGTSIMNIALVRGSELPQSLAADGALSAAATFG
jgi:hypothetical protein